ncbi:sensor histidine kinase [Actinomadura rupiterrae]|uniref:sensor histidine kinase n=1 Tax=Actinomadura rupiterrae TaxID=559627 RepID=UPI0020A395E7|nr:HAMP domain-containing sensor histidine kinase [Actinomadura rupiterrae]MCP2340254.1 signal transduction histidine kinase [Actinomadura rupiterrae]
MRLRPRSIRARDTLVAAVLAAVVFGGIAAGADLGIRGAENAALVRDSAQSARRTSAAIRDGSLASPIPDDSGGRVLIQVVGPGGNMLDTTPAAGRHARVSAYWPPRDERVRDYEECKGHGLGRRCTIIEAIRVTTAPDSVVVYAATGVPALLVNGALEALLVVAVLVLSALAAWVTWRVVGRTLRPVEMIRAQLAEISGSDLSRRVPQPSGEDEIAQLAATANQTLDRLERAVNRQRQFASDASHELRTPIAGLRANLEDASMHPEDTDLKGVVESALRDTDRLEHIVTDLLLLARIGTGNAAREDLDLGELARRELARRAAVPRAADAPRLVADLALDVGVRGVRMQFVRLLGNLLDNAERYADGTIAVSVSSSGGTAVLTVQDDGTGVPEADRERVFERFTRLDSARSRHAGGTGLGLAIAREIAQAHGGSLTIEDSARGARFVLRLPLHT